MIKFICFSRKQALLPVWLLFLWLKPYATTAGEIILKPNENNKLTVLESTTGHMLVLTTFGHFVAQPRQTDKGNFAVLEAASCSYTNIAGNPRLPVFSRLIEVPANASIRVKTLKFTRKEYKLVDLGIADKIYPSQPPQSKNSIAENALVINQKLYETNALYGEPLARVEQAGIMRGVQLASLVISPVQYNPVTNSISVYDSLQVEIFQHLLTRSLKNM